MSTIRQETASDREAVLRVNEEAFGRDNEARIVDALHEAEHVTLSLVAVQEDAVLGHVLFSSMTIESDAGVYGAVCLGPIAVSPAYQGKGIGSQLIEAGLEELRGMGHKVVCLLGHPEYYPRFGFRPARDFDVHYGEDWDAFMAVELQPGALDGISGNAVFAPQFAQFG